MTNMPTGYDYLAKPIIIYCCKDRTLTYAPKGQGKLKPIKPALPVFSVDTIKDAEELIVTVSRKQYNDHPDIPGFPWYKITLDGQLDLKTELDVLDLEAVTQKLFNVYGTLKFAKAIDIDLSTSQEHPTDPQQQVGRPTKSRKPKRKRPPSRAQRWADACAAALTALEELRAVQEEYEEWQGNLPENLQSSALGEKLDEVCNVDIEGAKSTVEEAEGMDLPVGFGRD